MFVESLKENFLLLSASPLAAVGVPANSLLIQSLSKKY